MTKISKTMANLLFNKNLNILFMLLFCVCSGRAATEISPILGVGSDTFSFNIESLGNNTKTLEYVPNIPGLTKYGLSAYGFGVSYSTRASVSTLDPAKGLSDFFDLQLGYNNYQWGLDLFVQNYTGFYIQNLSPTSGTNPYFLFPNLKWNHYGLMGRWAMDNQGFLISALTTQSEQIKKSAGSYFLVGGYRYHSLDNDASIIPSTLQGINSEMDNLLKMKTNSLNFGVGAGKYWVNDSHFFAGGLFDLLGTYGLYNYESTTGTSNSSYATLSFDIKLGVGYSGEKFRSGLSVAGDITTLQGFKSSYIKPSATQALLYFRIAF